MSGRDGAERTTADRMSASRRGAPAGLSTGCCLLPEPALGLPTGVADDRLLDDGGLGAATSGTEPTSVVEPIALDCAPPLICASPLRGSLVTVDPIDVAVVIPVDLLDVGPVVDDAAEEPLDGGSSEPAAAVPGLVVPVPERLVPVPERVVPVPERLVPVAVLSPGDDVADESVADEPEFVGSAHATPGVVAIDTPTPNAIANPPTRPMHVALFMAVPLAAQAPR